MKKIRLLILISMIFVLVFQMGGIGVARAQSLEELQRRQKELNKQINDQKNQLNAQKKTITTTQDMVNSLESQIQLAQQEINAATNQIDLTSKKINETTKQIEERQSELDVQKGNLFEAMRVIYETPQQSTVEIIVGSNSISEVVDRAQYIESLEYQIETTINTITQLKAQLESERNQLEKEKKDLEDQKTTLVNKSRNLDIQQNEKKRLLDQMTADKSKTQTLLNQSTAERDEVSAEIYALRRSQGNYRGGYTDYPFASESDTGCAYSRDPWAFCYRQCTSYAAWYWNDKLGKSWYNTRVGSGSAWNWPALASDQGYNVSSTPRVGAIVSWPAGGIFGRYGHVAIVEAVNSDGTFEVSQYNWSPISYSEMHVGSDLAASARFIY
ncbi:MAG: CHAP domain-containing protein [Patescibacteria group bacterium]